ncbi:hypothetical protein ACIA2T_19645 [Amycolatopsis japonica]|uniref:hypothetical protein n=1 Tax=Amycolatopsis japonica TaxID=208439 RepID=UPI0037A7631C
MMDWAAILAALPEVGVTGVLLMLLVYGAKVFFTQDKHHDDRTDQVYDKTVTEMKALYEHSITELRTEIATLRTEIAALRTELEIERAARRKAEEEAHQLRTQN